LCQDDVGTGCEESGFVYRVQASACLKQFADSAIDLRAGQLTRINDTANDYRLLLCLVWIVALVGHADDLIAEAEQISDLRRAGQQGTDSHACMISLSPLIMPLHDLDAAAFPLVEILWLM
jgi:hypothetical protein